MGSTGRVNGGAARPCGAGARGAAVHSLRRGRALPRGGGVFDGRATSFLVRGEARRGAGGAGKAAVSASRGAEECEGSGTYL